MANCYFIYNNLKVNPFVLQDRPVPGFKLIAWKSWTVGTLWELDDVQDVGFTTIGQTKVYGQVWRPEDNSQVSTVEQYFGMNQGLTLPVDIAIVVEIDDLVEETLKAKTFALSKISSTYEIIRDGRWRF
jgi:hypothetical protein